MKFGKQLFSTIILVSLMGCNFNIKKNEENMDLDFPNQYTEELKSKMKTSFWKCNDDSQVNSALHYYVLIPNNVKPNSLTEKNIPGSDVVKEIASYQRIDKSPYLEVQVVYELLSQEINPSDWQYSLLKDNQETIINRKEIQGKSEKFLDALTQKEYPNGETVISRSTAQKNYDPSTEQTLIMSIKVSCNVNDYPELAEEMMAIAKGWNFINKSEY